MACRWAHPPRISFSGLRVPKNVQSVRCKSWLRSRNTLTVVNASPNGLRTFVLHCFSRQIDARAVNLISECQCLLFLSNSLGHLSNRFLQLAFMNVSAVSLASRLKTQGRRSPSGASATWSLHARFGRQLAMDRSRGWPTARLGTLPLSKRVPRSVRRLFLSGKEADRLTAMAPKAGKY